MLHRLYKRPIFEILFLGGGMLVVLGVLTVLTVLTHQDGLYRTSTTTEITHIQPVAAEETCTFDSGQPVPLGTTETDTSNSDPRMPISTHRHEYDFFSAFGPATFQEAQQSNLATESLGTYLSFPPRASTGDEKVRGLLGKIFGYRPTRLAHAYFMKYLPGTPRGNDTLVKGVAPAIKVPTIIGDTITAPDTGYDLGEGIGSMVEYASSDRITLHIGRQEYFAGDPVGKNCRGAPCNGGYWLYLKGLCVDKQILDAYNAVKSAQEAAGPDLQPIQMPVLAQGRVIGKTVGSPIDVVLRGGGPLISVYQSFFWDGVPIKDIYALAQVPPSPTLTPTDTPTPTPLPFDLQPSTTSTPSEADISVPFASTDMLSHVSLIISQCSDSEIDPDPSPFCREIQSALKIDEKVMVYLDRDGTVEIVGGTVTNDTTTDLGHDAYTISLDTPFVGTSKVLLIKYEGGALALDALK